MREHLYRGICIHSELGWAEGSLIVDMPKTDELYNITGRDDFNRVWDEPVKPETVGQYTGLKDKNGVKVFEGDIVRAVNVYGYIFEYIVEWNQNLLRWCFKGEGQIFDIKDCEIIGNIHCSKD